MIYFTVLQPLDFASYIHYLYSSVFFPLLMADIRTEHSKIGSGENGSGNDVSREDVQAALAKAVELRALHAALTLGDMRFSSASSPVSCLAPPLSAQDYPVFTPSYEDEPLPGYQYHLLENRKHPESWGEHTLDSENVDQSLLPDYPKPRKGLLSEFISLEGLKFPAEDQNSGIGSCANDVTVLEESPRLDSSKSRRNSKGEFKSVSSCNRCNPGLINSESVSRTSLYSPPRNRVLKFPRLFSSKKKNKNENSPARPKPVEVSDSGKDSEIVSIEMLKKELEEVKETRDLALIEVAEMKGSLVDLSKKMAYMETYCGELKKALRQEKLTNLPKRGKPGDENAENLMPVSEEVMVEGFLQFVAETRLSMKQFSKILVAQIEETDHSLIDSMNMHLQPHKLSLNSKYSKAVLYHIEAIINHSLYQDFENCIFQKSGPPKILDPHQDRQAQFQSFVALRNLCWNEVLRKGTKYYSDEFSKFCDDKMSGIIATLGWTRPWPEQLLQAFFVAAKCVWLLHLLAFSFNPPLGILRVYQNMPFEPHYMEDIFADRQRSQGPSRVKIMVMPGFYVHDRVLRCKVLCRYKSV